MKHLVKIQNPLHVAMCARVDGESIGQIEAGATVKLDWMPSSGWGLQDAHYTDDQYQVVQIDLETREFTMPDYDIVIEGTAKRFSVEDWEGYEGGGGSVVGNEGDVIQSDGNGGIAANNKVNVSAGGNMEADGNVIAGGNMEADGSMGAKGDVIAGGNMEAGGSMGAKGDVIAGGNMEACGHLQSGTEDAPGLLIMWDDHGNKWNIKVDGTGQLVVTSI